MTLLCGKLTMKEHVHGVTWSLMVNQRPELDYGISGTLGQSQWLDISTQIDVCDANH